MKAPWLNLSKEVQNPTFSWQSHGHCVLGYEWLLMVDYKPAGISITGAYYTDLMKQLRTAIKE